MSFEPGSPIDSNPISNIDEPKSGKKKWLIGGCGCLSLIAILCIAGGGLLFIKYGKPVFDLMEETNNLVENSPQVQNVLGAPIELGTPSQSQGDEPGVLLISIPVSGPNGAGTVKYRIRFDGKWVREELYLEFEGERIDLDLEKEFDLDIDEGL
jgi:hypothetical protein